MRVAWLVSLWLRAAVGAAAAVGGGEQVPLRGDSGVVKEPDYGHDEIHIADKAFEKYVEGQMSKWHVPGLAIALLDGNRTWTKGFGHATLDTHPVTPDTLFYCGSMTKSFTAAAISLLVDNSSAHASIQWHTPVSHLLRDDFVLSDPWATAHVTVADALAHRTGYPRHDYSGPYHNSSAALVRALRHLPMSAEPRVKWQYCNMMYAAMGYLVERLTGESLADFFRDRLWRPMGMWDTFLHPDDALAAGEGRLAHPYYWNNDTETYGEIPWRDETSIAGAGMSISSVSDWSRYVRHMIDETGPISAAGHEALKAANMVAEHKDRLFVGPVWYGFGWQGSVFQNEAVYYHSGLVDSMMSLMVMIPGRKFGFVLMMNSEGTPVLDSIIAKTLYDYFEVDEAERFDMETDWVNILEDFDERLGNCSTRLYPTLSSPALPPPIPLAGFVGEYHDPGYGTVTVERRCDTWEHPADSPARPSQMADGCRLAVTRTSVFGKRVSYQLEHKSGDFWVGWYFNDDFASVRRPTECFRARFRLDEAGRSAELGLDVRMEGDEVPLTWFRRGD